MNFIFGSNDYLKLRRGKYRLLVHKDFANSQLANHLASGIDELKKHYELVHVPSSDTALIYKFNCQGDALYYKQHRFRDWRDVLKHTFRPNRAMRAMKGSLLLQKHGFEAPKIIAIGHRSCGPLHYSSFTITRQAPGSSLYGYWNSLKEDSTNSQQKRRQLIQDFAAIVGTMHTHRIKHGDLRLGNVLISQTDGKLRFVFLDNERTGRFLFMPAKQRIKNLIQINMFRQEVANTDRLRFLITYLKACSKNDLNMRKLIAKIERITSRRLKKKGRL